MPRILTQQIATRRPGGQEEFDFSLAFGLEGGDHRQFMTGWLRGVDPEVERLQWCLALFALEGNWRGIGAPERSRTSDLRLRRPSLYPAELRARASLGLIGGTH